MFDIQKIFTKGFRGMREQGFERSIQGDPGEEMCCYLTTDGRRCVIGHALTEEQIEKLGHKGWGMSAENALTNLGETDHRLLVMAQQLQDIHDQSDKPEEMESEFRRFAKEYGLEVPT